MKKKTNAYLIEYCLAQVGNPYWFGCYGQVSSLKLLDEKKKQYPKMYTATNFKKQLGVKVHDCSGLIKGAYWCNTPTSTPKYDAKTDYGANALYNNCTKKGKIASFDKVNGRCVFKGNDKTKTHVGVYYNGYVLEAKGHAYGVVKTKFKASDWPYWGQSNLFEEDKTPEPTPAPAKKTVKATNKPKSHSKLYAKTYTVNTKIDPLKMRNGPSINYTIMTKVKKGQKVVCDGDYTDNWLYVKYETETTIYIGFMSKNYLK